VWESVIVLDDPQVHIMGHGACTPTFFTAHDLMLELCAVLQLEALILELLLPLPQLL
jgi:hypothetical protein